MNPSSEYIPSEGEAARKAYVPRGYVLPLSSLEIFSPAKAACADKTLFALRRTLWHSESPKIYKAERWMKQVRTPH
jgi:hypothetical protein